MHTLKDLMRASRMMTNNDRFHSFLPSACDVQNIINGSDHRNRLHPPKARVLTLKSRNLARPNVTSFFSQLAS